MYGREFVAATKALGTDRSVAPAILQWILPAAQPYAGALFGDEERARKALSCWVLRSSSEVAMQRAELLLVDDESVGGYIALSGKQLRSCRLADSIAALAKFGPLAAKAACKARCLDKETV